MCSTADAGIWEIWDPKDVSLLRSIFSLNIYQIKLEMSTSAIFNITDHSLPTWELAFVI